jgi:hypothetical protein
MLAHSYANGPRAVWAEHGNAGGAQAVAAAALPAALAVRTPGARRATDSHTEDN